jgi:DNA-directed RNA polymerase
MQTFTAMQYLKIDVASAFGLDRTDWCERLSWFDQNRHQLHQITNQAKEPALFFAAVEAFETAERGQPIGHMISLDATASGIQILSVISGDERAARHCNVLNTGHRQDAYTNIDTIMRSYVDFPHVERKDSKFALKDH